MIHIEKGETVFGNRNLRVVTATGDYEDVALIECSDTENGDGVAGAFQAQYVKYGSLVYRFSDPAELGKEILKVDPESTHTAASYVRMTNELLAKMNDGTLEPSSLDEVVTTQKEAITDTIKPKPKDKIKDLGASPATTTLPVINIPTPSSTSTPPVVHDDPRPIEPAVDDPPARPTLDSDVTPTQISPAEEIPELLDDVVTYTKKKMLKLAKNNLKKRLRG